MIFFLLLSLTFSGCHEQGYAGNITVHSICVWSIVVWTRCSASHIQIGPRLACLNLLAMQPSTPISAYHHIKIIHKYIHTQWHYENMYTHVHTSQSIFSILKSSEASISFILIRTLIFHSLSHSNANIM